MGRRSRIGWLAFAALALALCSLAPAGAQVVARADMLGGKLVPASTDPSADIASARAVDLDVARAAGSRNPRCLTPAEAAQLDELARLLDAVRTYIDTQERGWTGSGFPTHADVPEHGAPTAAEVALDGLKSAYWVLRGDFERLSRIPPCTPPPPPGAGVMPGPPPGTSQPPEPPEKGGAATSGTGTGQTQPGGEGGGVGPPEPPDGVPLPPATACLTDADATYIKEQSQALREKIDERDVKYYAMQIRVRELAAAADTTNARFSHLSQTERDKLMDGDKSDIARETAEIATLDAEIFALRSYLAAEARKPPCGGQPGATSGGQSGGGGGDGGGGVGPPTGDNPNAPPTLPTPPPGKCRTAADDAYEAAVQAILDQARFDRDRLYAALMPLLLEEQDIKDEIEGARNEPDAQASLKAQRGGRLADLGQRISDLQLKIEALDATISAAEARLKHKKPPCQAGQSSMVAPPPASEGQTAAVPQDEGSVLQGIGVRVQKPKGPNRAVGEEGSGEEGSGESGTSQTPSQQQTHPTSGD